MNTSSEKIGHLIAHVRQERGLTQAAFAKLLNTSQSAVNRIEHGKQNLSIDTLGRISDVLNKQLITLGGKEVNLRIEGGYELHGEIALKTSKNAAVALLCASLLNYGVTRFTSFPKIEEVYRIIEVLESIGVKIKWIGSDIEIRRPKQLKLENIDAEASRKTRSVLMMMGPLLHDAKEFRIPYSGGCKLGERTVEPHLFALQEFGVDIAAHKGFYEVTVDKKPAERIVLYEQGNTVTNNALLAAARFEEPTIIQSASADYMVQDLCIFLKKLGVRIDNIGSGTLTVHGVKEIKKNITYALTEDPIEAMFFMSVAVTTNSEITVRRVPIDWVALEVLKLEKMGVELTKSARYKAANGVFDLIDITVHKHEQLLALPDKIHPNLWPGLNADNLPYFVPIAGVLAGRTLIHDWMYENRAIYYTEMTKVGMQVELADPHRLFVVGPTKFVKADVVCPPALRPASLLLIGMLAAEGISTLRNIYTINRGYEDIAERLNSLGAHIQVFHEM
ncbi:MAG TPA: UDP-N-acetylglucosamine 1-carboxyvinyltransferase [Candidatus Saccharimonadales bacterium]|nr:UDP-N-acetylglucosamine 1-carboxyvinyltransferase [Candidatus Saccharimonadales bacterium]